MKTNGSEVYPLRLCPNLLPLSTPSAHPQGPAQWERSWLTTNRPRRSRLPVGYFVCGTMSIAPSRRLSRLFLRFQVSLITSRPPLDPCNLLFQRSRSQPSSVRHGICSRMGLVAVDAPCSLPMLLSCPKTRPPQRGGVDRITGFTGCGPQREAQHIHAIILRIPSSCPENRANQMDFDNPDAEEGLPHPKETPSLAAHGIIWALWRAWRSPTANWIPSR